MSTRTAAIAAAGLLGLAASAVVALYLASALFLIASKHHPRHASLSGWFTYWNAYQDDRAIRKRLQMSAAASGGLVFVVLPLCVVAGLRKKRPLHGDARFASFGEVRKSGLLKAEGIVVGKYRGKYLALPGQEFVLLAAPTRTGKGVGVVIPNLLSWPGSVMVLDIKGENFEHTAGFRAQHGQHVFAFRPYDESGATHRFNPLSQIRTEERFRVGDIQAIGAVLFPTTGREDSGSTEKFFNEKARDLFLGLALFLLETSELPFTFGELLRQSSGKGRPIKEHLQRVIAERERSSKPLSDECVDALDRFVASPDNTLGSIQATFNAPLAIFADPLVDAATSASDFALGEVRRDRISIYIVIPPGKLSVCSLLINLLFSQLIELNTRELPAASNGLVHPCLLLMDEFTSMGRVSVLAKGVSFLAGYGLRFLTIIQSQSQLASVYGEKEAKNFVSNHALQIVFAPREQSDAEEYSRMLGTYTEAAESRGRSRPTALMGKGGSSSSNVSDQRRALMLPQELRELGAEREIVLINNCKPILADKIRYYNDPTFTSRLAAAPALPVVDLDLHIAKVQGRKRTLVGGDLVDGVKLESLAHELNDLPTLGDTSTPEDVSTFVSEFFDRLDVKADVSGGEGRVVQSINARVERASPPRSPRAVSRVDLAQLEVGA